MPKYDLTVHSGGHIQAPNPEGAIVRFAFALIETTLQHRWEDATTDRDRKSLGDSYQLLVEARRGQMWMYIGSSTAHAPGVEARKERERQKPERRAKKG